MAKPIFNTSISRYAFPSSSVANCLLIAASTLLDKEYSAIRWMCSKMDKTSKSVLFCHSFIYSVSECQHVTLSVLSAIFPSQLFTKEGILHFFLEWSWMWSLCLTYRYIEDVFIMEEQSNDSMAVPVGGICCVCNQPCCLQSSCSAYYDNKRYCIHHLPITSPTYSLQHQ